MSEINVSSTFKFCPRCGCTAFRVQEDHLVVCAGCDFHYHINPVAAAAAFIEDDQGMLLLIRRAKEPAKGRLGLPGGFVDLGETAEEALRREILEEVNLKIEALEYVSSHPNRYFYSGITYPVLDLFYGARVASFAGAAPKSEVSELVVLPVMKVKPDDLAFPSMAQALAIYRIGGSRF